MPLTSTSHADPVAGPIRANSLEKLSDSRAVASLRRLSPMSISRRVALTIDWHQCFACW